MKKTTAAHHCVQLGACVHHYKILLIILHSKINKLAKKMTFFLPVVIVNDDFKFFD